MKRIVIMGATSGIGLETAKRCIAAGWRVGAAGRRSEELERLRGLAPQQVETEAIDVTDDAAPAALERLIERLDGMDVYLHVAGVGSQNPQLDPAVELHTVRTNVEGFTRMTTAAYGYFAAHGGGRIAVVSSIAGTRGLGVAAAYSASKRFQNTYIDSLAQLARMQGSKIRHGHPSGIRRHRSAPKRGLPDAHAPREGRREVVPCLGTQQTPRSDRPPLRPAGAALATDPARSVGAAADPQQGLNRDTKFVCTVAFRPQPATVRSAADTRSGPLYAGWSTFNHPSSLNKNTGAVPLNGTRQYMKRIRHHPLPQPFQNGRSSGSSAGGTTGAAAGCTGCAAGCAYPPACDAGAAYPP